MHSFWRNNSVIFFENISSTAFSTLTVNSDNAFVLSSNIMRIDCQIWHIPNSIFCHINTRSHSFANCILMRTRKSCENKFANIRHAFINRHSSQFLIFFSDFWNICKIKFRINTLSKHIQTNIYNIQISSTFTISKKTTFHTVSSSKQTKFTLSNTFTTVIMIVQRNDKIFTI